MGASKYLVAAGTGIMGSGAGFGKGGLGRSCGGRAGFGEPGPGPGGPGPSDSDGLVSQTRQVKKSGKSSAYGRVNRRVKSG